MDPEVLLIPKRRKEDRPSGRLRKGLYILPSLFTAANMAMGYYAILQTTHATVAEPWHFDFAAKAIGFAVLFDGLDGRIARALKGTSRFGAELDSLADFVDFGVAPALVLYLSGLEKLKALGWMATLVFAIACSLRLARFNVMIYDPDLPPWRRTFFVGMPAPAGAIVGLLPVYCGFLVSGGAPASPFLWLELAYVLGVALLMASRVPHFSGKSIGRVPREYVAVVLIALAVALLLIVSYPLQALIALSLLYLTSIPFSIRQFQRLRRENG